MTTPEIITAASHGNLQAAQFLSVFVRRAHLIDDLVDGDKTISAEQVAQAEWDWLVVLTGNPFFVAHKDRLLGVIAMGLNAWLDANVLQARWDTAICSEADVLKGQWHDVVRLVALLTGGWQAMRELSPQLRDYDWEVPVKEQCGAAPANVRESRVTLEEHVKKMEET